MILPLLDGAVRAGTPVLFTSLGEVVAERAGVINLGAEGSMLVGALTAFAVTAHTGNPYLGVLAGGGAGALLALVHAYLVIARRANQLASGLTLMILALGITAFFGRPYVSVQIRGLDPVLFGHDILTYIALLLVPAVWWLLHRTRSGLVLRAVGERDEVAYACGYRPELYRCAAVLFGGFLAGIGGAHLSIAYTLNWVENITQGRGLVAVALVIFASWSPWKVVLGSYLFGGALALQFSLQAGGAAVSPFLLSMVPYVLTLAVLVFVGRRRHAMPEGLRAVFARAGG